MARKEILAQIQKYIDPFRVTKGKDFRLKDMDPGDTRGLRLDKGEAGELLQRGTEWLAEQQDMLYAQDRWSLLLIFQALDAAGKDSTIKHVMSGINPQGCQVFSFKQPSSEELDHDFMWRYAKCLPERGRIGIFNRSYYEEVLVVRVHHEILKQQKLPPPLVGKGIWDERLADIAHFEDYLARQGTKVLKFFLNVSLKEQKKRFIQRLDEPEKNWKFSASDVREREFWSDYMRAFEEAIGPVDDQLVHVREALGRDELRARVTHGDAVADEPAERRKRRGEVDGAEDVHPRPRRERGDEHLVLADSEDARRALAKERACRLRDLAVLGRVWIHQRLFADPVARDTHRERDRLLGLDSLGDWSEEARLERVHEDVNSAAAGKANLEGLLVRDSICEELRRASGQDGLRLLVHGWLDAPSRDRPGDLAVLGDGEDCARVPGR